MESDVADALARVAAKDAEIAAAKKAAEEFESAHRYGVE